MTLEAAAIHHQDLFGLNPNPFLLESWSGIELHPTFFQDYENVFSYDSGFLENQLDQNDWNSLLALPSLNDQEWVLDSPVDEPNNDGHPVEVAMRPRRRRARAKKDKEVIENQRITHIAVERNRRKQMNEYLNMLRSLMPDSYVQRGDQASIVGGAINFVKELEQNLHCLIAKKQMKENCSTTSLPFQECFNFPQYSSSGGGGGNDDRMKISTGMSHQRTEGSDFGRLAADVEVTLVESHANLKIRSTRRPKQLSKLVSGLLCLRLTILHLNVNSAQGVVLYSFSLKVEDDSKLSTVDEIASAVYQLLGRIQEDEAITFNS